MQRSRNRFVRLSHAAWAAALVAVLATAPLPHDPEAHRAQREAPNALSLVSAAPVASTVREVPVAVLSAAQGRALAGRSIAGRRLLALSGVERVEGYGAVGVTWGRGHLPAESDLRVSLRTLTGEVWSDWQTMSYDPEHGPDAGSPEERHSRPGTDAVIVGDVDDVQIKVEAAPGVVVDDLSLAVIDPGAESATVRARPAIDTARLASDGDLDPVSSEPGVTPRPQIFSRAQWGANEDLRDKSALHYFEVHAAFVHHTVNANDYTRDQVPAIIRGIYAYHTQSRGWSDVGYNFLVDRFGRIWEGRFGGVDRPVVGAHTLGYNDYAFAASAIGNFEQATPTAAVLDAYGRLFAWKLSLHGVDAGSTRQQVGGDYFKAINGHRDAGSTACPGQNLYDRLPRIRNLAVGYQHSWSARERDTDLTGDGYPDVVARNSSDKQLYVVPTAGQFSFLAPVPVLTGWQNKDFVVPVGDVTGDGRPDLLGRDEASGTSEIYPGTASGGFGPVYATLNRFAGFDMLHGVGDWNADGLADLVGRRTESAALVWMPGRGNASFGRAKLLVDNASWIVRLIGTGNFAGDKRFDLVAQSAKGPVVFARTDAGVSRRKLLAGDWSTYSTYRARGDLTGDGAADLLARATDGTTVVLPGDRAGGFGHPIGPLSIGTDLDRWLIIGNLNGVPGIDLVTRNSAGVVSLVANAGRQNLLPAIPTGVDVSRANLILNVGDWNSDGHIDVMTRNGNSGDLVLRPGNGLGLLGNPVVVAKDFNGVRMLSAVGDVTGDGFPDLMGQPVNKAMRIYPGNGSTGFKASYAAHSAIDGVGQIGFGRFDADGAPDSLIRRDGALFKYFGNGPGGLIAGDKLMSVGAYSWTLGSGDVNGDSEADLLVRETATGYLWFLPGTATGFGARRFVGSGFDVYDLAG
jgi:hypothetical protein